MNYLNSDFNTPEDGLIELKDGVKLFHKMGGIMYRQILRDDCNEIAARIRAKSNNDPEVYNKVTRLMDELI